MTFTYTPGSVTDITRVRFHIGDTEEDAAIFSDEEIQMVITEEGTYQKAVVECLTTIIAKLSAEPDMKADWLSVSLGRSVDGFKALLAEKRRKFNLPISAGRTVVTYRSDSLQDEAPDW